MCKYLKVIGINEEKQICLPNREYISDNRCEGNSWLPNINYLLGINFSLEQNRFFKGTQAFANPTDLASSRCMGKCFPCPDTWFCWCQGKNFPYNIICLFAKLLPNGSDYCCCHWLLYFLVC